ncbi:hypothetical protein [Thiolapillus sp.]
MSHGHEVARVPLRIWAASFVALLLVIGIADQLYHRLPPTEAERLQLQKCFQVERLNSLRQPAVVVMGTSAVRHGFPFDGDLEQISLARNSPIHFIRFSRDQGSSRDFSVLLDAILQARPQWVFIQAEPLVLELQSSWLPRRILEAARVRIHFLARIVALELAQALGGKLSCRRMPQDDSNVQLDRTATPADLRNPLHDSYHIRVPALPEFTRFIAEAKKRNIRVVLLEMNRSREGNESFGPAFRPALDKALQALAATWNIPLWQFRGDLSRDHFADRGHLNRQGRQVFTRWFLSRLEAEQGND